MACVKEGCLGGEKCAILMNFQIQQQHGISPEIILQQGNGALREAELDGCERQKTVLAFLDALESDMFEQR